MLETLRRGAQGWTAKILFGLLVVSFGFWGISGSFSGYGEGSLARVGKTEISTAEFQQSYQAQFDNLRRRFGGRITAEQARSFGFDQQVLSQLIGGVAIDNHTKELQLGLPEDVLAERFKKDQRFLGVDGKFSRPAFDFFLRQNNLTERSFLNIARKDEVRDQLTIALVESVQAPATTIEMLHKFREEARKISYFTVDPSKVPAVGEPDDAKLQELYEQRKATFMTQEQRNAAVMTLTVDDVKKNVTVTDADIKAAYEQDPERFNTPEKRRVQQISFADKAKAEAAAKEIAGGKPFTDVATEAGAKDSDIDLGLVTKREMIDPKIAEAAFKLDKDQVSPVVEGRFVNALVRVTEIEAGKQKSLADVSGEIKDRLALERASGEIQKLHDQVDDSRSAGKTLKEAAAALKLPLIEVAGVDRTGQTGDGKPALSIPGAEAIVAAIFANKPGVESEPVELADNGYAWIEVQAITAAKQREFAEVKGDVKKLWTDTETRKALGTTTQKFVERLNAGEPIEKVADDAGGKVTTTDPTLRGGKPTGLTEQAISQAFALAAGAISSTESADGKSRIVFKVAEIIPAPPITPAQSEKIKAEVVRQMQSETMAEYLVALQERYGVSINNAAFQRAVGADRQTQ
jgi:peptidyl-prolyl cis-trans isomerase D